MAQTMTVRHHHTTTGADRWWFQFRWPRNAPEEMRADTGVRPKLSFTDEALANQWATTFNAHGIIEGYTMYCEWYRRNMPEPEPGKPKPERAPTRAEMIASLPPSVAVAGRMKLRDVVLHWLDDKELLQECGPGHLQDLRDRYFLYVDPYFGDMWVDTIDRNSIARWLKDMITGVIGLVSSDEEMDTEPISPKYIRNIYSSMQGPMEWAANNVALTGVGANVCPRLRFPDDIRAARQPVFLSLDELAEMVQIIRPHFRDLILSAVGTGLRFGECAALQVEDVHVAGGVIRINITKALKYKSVSRIGSTKTKRGKRWVQISASTPVGEAILRRIAGKKPEDLVFTSPTGARLNNGHFHSRCWIPLMDTLNREFGWTRRVRFHDLRHTAASIMLNSGHDLFVVAKLLGHTVTTCERVYGHLNDKAGLAATTAIGQQLGSIFADRPDPDTGGRILSVAAEIYNENEPLAKVIDLNAMRRIRESVA